MYDIADGFCQGYVQANVMPDATSDADRSALNAMFPVANGRCIELPGMADVAARHTKYNKLRLKLEKAENRMKARLIQEIGDYQYMRSGETCYSLPTVVRNRGTEDESSYRQLRSLKKIPDGVPVDQVGEHSGAQ